VRPEPGDEPLPHRSVTERRGRDDGAVKGTKHREPGPPMTLGNAVAARMRLIFYSFFRNFIVQLNVSNAPM